MIDLRFAYGHCHALTAALLEFRPGGEAFGLFAEGSCVHSIFRSPYTDTLNVLRAHAAQIDKAAKQAMPPLPSAGHGGQPKAHKR